MKIKNALLTLIFVFSANAANAQTSLMSSGLRRNIATVMFFGVGGAVLGLSTLSFYGKPQEHIENITVGLAIGLIGGTVYVVSQNKNSNENTALKTLYGKDHKRIHPGLFN